jgi:hypothetical protein
MSGTISKVGKQVLFFLTWLIMASGSYVLKEWLATPPSSKFTKKEMKFFENEAKLLKQHSRNCPYITGRLEEGGEEERGKRKEGRGKREEGRGKREEGRGKREEGRGKREKGEERSFNPTHQTAVQVTSTTASPTRWQEYSWNTFQ